MAEASTHYVVLDANQLPAAWYHSDIFPPGADGSRNAAIPAGAIAQTTAQWQDCIDNPGRRRIVDGAPVAFIPPPMIFVPQTILRRQFYQQLAAQGIITADEALAAVQSGALPAEFTPVIAKLPADAQFGAKMVLSGDPTFARTHPVTIAIAAAYGWLSDQVDALWVAAAAL